jgi:hypothetical protein
VVGGGPLPWADSTAFSFADDALMPRFVGGLHDVQHLLELISRFRVLARWFDPFS